jgi:hypothetical protein
MQTQVAVKNRGLTVGVALTVAAAPSAAALARDDGAGAGRPAHQRHPRRGDAGRHPRRDRGRARSASSPSCASRSTTSPYAAGARAPRVPFGDDRVVTDDQHAAADELIADYAAAFAAQE